MMKVLLECTVSQKKTSQAIKPKNIIHPWNKMENTQNSHNFKALLRVKTTRKYFLLQTNEWSNMLVVDKEVDKAISFKLVHNSQFLFVVVR